MDRGLSHLQKKILLLAYIRGGTTFEHRGKRLSTSNVDISTGDVLTEVLKSNSDKARVSVSRTFKRLRERGLVKRFHQYTRRGRIVYSGVKLTPAGREKAKELLVSMILKGKLD